MIPLKQQNQSSYKIEIKKNHGSETSFAGLALLRRCLSEMCIVRKIQNVFYKKGYLKKGGFQDHAILECIVLLLASGGNSFSDWEYLRNDPGFKKILGSVPCVDVLERYLDKLGLTEINHNCKQGMVGYSTLLEMIHKEIITMVYKLKNSPKELTLDIDASLFQTYKKKALFCYDKYKAYQPMVVYCPELGIVIAHEFRDGNISPQTGFTRLVERFKDLFPGVKIRFRSDSAAYQIMFMDNLEANNIEYFITADQFNIMSETLKKETKWSTYINRYGVKTEQEHAEISYVPTFSNQQELKLRSESMRFIAIRKPKTGQLELGEEKYIYQVISTNSQEMDIDKIFNIHWERCGSIERCFSQLKSGCGMRRMPSSKFHVNAAWFSMGLLTHNILKILQTEIMPKSLKKIELATLAFRFLRSAATVVRRGKQTIIRFCKSNLIYKNYKYATQKLEDLVYKLHRLEIT